MIRLSKSRASLINQSGSVYHQASQSENFEKSKKLYYSALVLMVQDKIDEKEQASKISSSDVFWSKLETMISRHSAQMDRVAQRAADVRSNLSSERKSIDISHAERMNKAKKQLKILQKQIEEKKAKVLIVENRVQEKEAEKAYSKIEKLNLKIEQYNFHIKNLKNSTSDLKKKIEQTRNEFEMKSSDLEQRRKNADSNAEQISEKLESVIQQTRKVDENLKNLEQQEKICIALYESLKQPLSSIQKIFSNQ